LNERLVLVVRVPLTEGEMLPLPFVSTGGRSELTPASAERRCVKLRVEVGTLVSSSALSWRKVAAVSRCTNSALATISKLSPTAPATS
jgi:hypothetical protein